MDHRGKVVRPLELDFEAGDEGLLHQRQRLRVGGVNMFQQDFAVIDGIGQRDHPGKEDVVRRKFARLHDVEAADDVRHETRDLLEIADVIAHQCGVHGRELGGTHRDVTIVELLRAQEFAGRSSGQWHHQSQQ